MTKHHLLETEVESIIKVWNENCKYNGIDKIFAVVLGKRLKKLKIADKENKIHTGTLEIAELCLVVKEGTITKLIYRCEVPMDGSIGKRMNETQWKNSLLRSFLYECIGTFSSTCIKFFDDKQLAEYDLDMDRLKGDAGYLGIKIKVDKDTEDSWYKVGEEYEIFTQNDKNTWGVYSYRNDHQNGIGAIPLIHAKIIKEEKEPEKIKISKTKNNGSKR